MIGEPRGRYLVLLSGFEGDQGVKIIAEHLVAMSCMTAAWETPDVFKVEAIFRRAKTCAGSSELLRCRLKNLYGFRGLPLMVFVKPGLGIKHQGNFNLTRGIGIHEATNAPDKALTIDIG